MKEIMINGTPSEINSTGLNTMGELIELIKGSIDPDHMITSINLDGHDLAESDWVANPSRFETSIMEIQTGTPEEFVAAQLASSPEVVRACYLSFREARKLFQSGKMQDGNKQLVQATAAVKAFFEWYGTMIQLMPEANRSRFVITERVNALMAICKKICQQQLYQSWWAIGETIKDELEPELDKLEDFCRQLGN